MILHSYGKNAAVAGRVEFHAFNVDVARLFEGVHPDMSHWTFAPCSWIMRLASSEPAGWITSSDQVKETYFIAQMIAAGQLHELLLEEFLLLEIG